MARDPYLSRASKVKTSQRADAANPATSFFMGEIPFSVNVISIYIGYLDSRPTRVLVAHMTSNECHAEVTCCKSLTRTTIIVHWQILLILYELS